MARLLLWIVVAWPVPALFAGALGWRGVWGSDSAFVDYLIPVPVAGGAFHTVTLLATTACLLLQRQVPPALAGLARGVLLGIALAAGTFLFDVQGGRWRLSENPLALFVFSDALLAQLFLAAFGGRSPHGRSQWIAAALVTVITPCAAVWLAQAAQPRREFQYVGSRQGPDRGDERIYVRTDIPVHASGFREAAAAYAEQWNPRSNVNTEDMAVHFFAATEAAERQDESRAALTLCLYQDGTPAAWHAGAGNCFAHETISERAQRLFQALDPSRPQEQRLRDAGMKACEGFRPTGDNAASRFCARFSAAAPASPPAR